MQHDTMDQEHYFLDDDSILEIMCHSNPSQFTVYKQVSKRWYDLSCDAIEKYREKAKSLLYGWGCKQNWPRGAAMMGKLADIGDDHAMMMNGWCLFNAAGVDNTAKNKYELILRSTHVYNRAYCLLNGWGGIMDDQQAIQTLLDASDQADPHLSFLLGEIYFIKKEYQKALQYYQHAGTHVGALNMIGIMYSGRFLQQDLATAEVYFEKAAKQGFWSAMFRIHTSANAKKIFSKMIRSNEI